MDKNVKSYQHIKDADRRTDETVSEQMRYNSPTITPMGMVKKITLSGGFTPQADSGTEYFPDDVVS